MSDTRNALHTWPDGQVRPEDPYRCGAFEAATGRQCLKLSDHDGPHEIDPPSSTPGAGERTETPRRAPTNCQQEPHYPGAETVAMSLRYPLMTCHHLTERCAIQEPHQTAECGEFAAASRPRSLDGDAPTRVDEICAWMSEPDTTEEEIAQRIASLERALGEVRADSGTTITHKENETMLDDRIFYGPHPCGRCGKAIAKASREQGGEEFPMARSIRTRDGSGTTASTPLSRTKPRASMRDRGASPLTTLEPIAAMLPCDVIVRAYGDEPVRVRAVGIHGPKHVLIVGVGASTANGAMGFPMDTTYPYDADLWRELTEAYEHRDGSVLAVWYRSAPITHAARASSRSETANGAQSE